MVGYAKWIAFKLQGSSIEMIKREQSLGFDFALLMSMQSYLKFVQRPNSGGILLISLFWRFSIDKHFKLIRRETSIAWMRFPSANKFSNFFNSKIASGISVSLNRSKPISEHSSFSNKPCKLLVICDNELSQAVQAFDVIVHACQLVAPQVECVQISERKQFSWRWSQIVETVDETGQRVC